MATDEKKPSTTSQVLLGGKISQPTLISNLQTLNHSKSLDFERTFKSLDTLTNALNVITKAQSTYKKFSTDEFPKWLSTYWAERLNTTSGYYFTTQNIKLNQSRETETDPTPEKIAPDTHGKKFKENLLSLIKNSNFEYGYKSEIDDFTERKIAESRALYLNYINEAFLENFHDEEITIGIVRAVSRQKYASIFPTGQLIALAGLSHESEKVVEASIRAYELWDNSDAISHLRKARVRSKWLSQYLSSVIEDLASNHVSTS